MTNKKLIRLTQQFITTRRELESKKTKGFFAKWALRRELKGITKKLAIFVKDQAEIQADIMRKQTIELYTGILLSNEVHIEIK